MSKMRKRYPLIRYVKIFGIEFFVREEKKHWWSSWLPCKNLLGQIIPYRKLEDGAYASDPEVTAEEKQEAIRKLKAFRMRAYNTAASGVHGQYPNDKSFSVVVEKGFSKDGSSWTALDGYTMLQDQ